MYVSTLCDYVGAGKDITLSVLICAANPCISYVLCMCACVCTHLFAVSAQPHTDLLQVTPIRQGKGQIHQCHETHQIRLPLTTNERLCPQLRAQVSGLAWAHLGWSWAELVSCLPCRQVPVASPA